MAASAGRVRRYSSSQITSDSVSRSETRRNVLFEIEIPCILLFLNRNKNSQNSPKRMHPKFPLVEAPIATDSWMPSSHHPFVPRSLTKS